MWIAIFVVLVILFVPFIYSNWKHEKKAKNAGGIRKRYDLLVNELFNSYEYNKLVKENNTSVVIRAMNLSVTTIYRIDWLYKSLHIRYSCKCLYMTEIKLKWVFNEHEDQKYMLYKINDDINNYFEKNQVVKKFLEKSPLLWKHMSEKLDF